MKKYLLMTFAAGTLLAQPLKLDMNVFAERRTAFLARMDSNAVAVFPCMPEYSRNLDVEFPYRQESNFYYLSGFEEPESFLIFSTARAKFTFVMGVRKRDPVRESWTGIRAGEEGAIAEFRADTAYVSDDFEKAVYAALRGKSKIYYGFGVNPEYDKKIQSMFVARRSGQNYEIVDPAPIVNSMRVIKNEGDWKMGLQRAVDISVDAHIAAYKAVKPKKYERQIQAVFEYVYRNEGSPRDGYPCIIGSGPNATILHYNENARQMNDGELVLMDCAAEYGYYSADITRTIPVNGTFSANQRTIYQLVLDAQNAAMRIVRPGLPYRDMTTAIDSVLGNGLLALGFIKEKKDFKMYSFHGYGHWIGLEVHDVGGYGSGQSVKLTEGMVFTIEPGVYVRPDVYDKMRQQGYSDEEIAKIRQTVDKFMNIGVRIEDDVAVTKTGYKNLSEGAPREIKAIEKMMK
jgi:Xaa-Pro aminopeptidase